MTIQNKHCLILLVTVFVLLMGTTMVSAMDENSSQVVQDVNSLSTPYNYDVDNEVQSDVATATAEADVEKITNTSDTTKTQTNTNDYKDTANAITKTQNKSLKMVTDTITVTSMADINSAINSHTSGDTLIFNLQNDILVTSGFNQFSGMTLTFNGNGHTIDGNNVNEFMQPSTGSAVLFNDVTLTNMRKGFQLNNLCNITINNSKIINNNLGSTFIDFNSANCNVTLNNSIVANNKGSQGTIFEMKQSGVALVNNCTIENNSATGSGAFMYVTGANCVVNVTNSHLNNNSAQGNDGGGVLFTNTNANLYFENNTFSANRGNRGSVINANNAGSKVTFVNNTVENHTVNSTNQGQYPNAILYVMDGNLEISGNTIRNNIANGTANLFTISGPTNLTNNSIINNSAQSGSIFHLFKENTIVNITGNYVAENIITNIGDTFIFKFYEKDNSNPPHSYQYSLPVQKAIIVDNTFNNNTYIPPNSADGKFVDILMSNFANTNNLDVHGNEYVHNALNVTTWDIIGKSSDDENYIINATVTLRSIYNDTVRNGTITLKDKDGNPIGTYQVVNGTCNITIPKNQVPAGTNENNMQIEFNSYFKHYQYYNQLKYSHITVDAQPNPVTLGNTVTISGDLTDQDDSSIPIAGGTITITINGEVYTTTTDSNGHYTLDNVPASVGTKQVTAEFNVDLGYEHSQAQTSFVVSDEAEKLPTDINIVLPDEVGKVFEPITIKVTLFNVTDHPDELVSLDGKTVHVNVTSATVDGAIVVTPYDGVITDGEYSFEYIPQNAIGINITATFDEDDIYKSDSDKKAIPEFSLINPKLTVVADPTTQYPGGNVRITATLTDDSGNPITGATVKITVDGVETQGLAPTDLNGQITFLRPNQAYKDEPYNVIAQYGGKTAVYAGATGSAQYRIIKYHTNLEITPIESGSVVLNQPFDITVTLTNNTDNTEPLSGKAIIVKVNNVVVYDGTNGTTNGDGQITFSYAVDNNSPFTIEAIFEGDEEYQDSQDRLDYTDEIELLTSIITIDIEKPTVIVNESVKITGNLMDSQDNVIKNANVAIKINNRVVTTVKTDENGDYELVLTKDVAKYVNYLQYSNKPYKVTASYAGEPGVILGDASTENYEVIKMPTTLTITPLEEGHPVINQPQEITITLNNNTVSDTVNGNTNPISGKQITVTINGNPVTFEPNQDVTDENGQITFTYTFDNTDEYVIKATFDEDDIYNASEDSITVTVTDTRAPTNATIDVVGGEHAKEQMDVTITLHDDEDNIIAYQDVVVDLTITGEDGVNSTPYTTDKDGQIKFTYTPANIHNVTITVNYAGNVTYKPCVNETIVKPALMPSTLTVDVDPKPSYINQSIVISGNLHDLNGNLAGKELSIYVNGELVSTETTDGNGNYDYTVTKDDWEKYLKYDDDSYIVKVDYPYELDITNGAEAITSYRVIKIPTKVEIDVPASVDNDTTFDITARVTSDVEGYDPINYEGNFTFDVGGTKTTVNVENGVATISYHATEIKNVTVSGMFGENDVFKYSNDTKTFEVLDTRTPTNATIELEGLDRVKQEFTVKATLYDTTTGQAIAKQDVIAEVIVDGDVKKTVETTTDDEGKFTFTYTPENTHEMTIRVSYAGNTTFAPSVNESKVAARLMKATITAEVNPNPSFIDQSIVISGNLCDLVEKLAGETVVITINGEEVGTTTTDENGDYSYTVTKDQWSKYLQYSEDSYVVEVENEFVMDVRNGPQAITTYKVIKMPTKLTIEDITDAKVNKTITIKVNLTNTTDGNISVIDGKALTITVNGQPIDTTGMTTTNGVISVTYTPKDNSTLRIAAAFAEDDMYQASTATSDVTVGVDTPTLTCNVNDSQLYVGESVNITGTLTNGQTAVTNAIIKLFINDGLVTTVVTNSTGGYSYIARDLTEGTYTVKAEFDGIENVLAKATSQEDNYVVSKIPTKTTVNVLNSTVGNVTIEVVVTEDADGYDDVITTGKLNITLGDSTVITQYDITGASTIIKLDDITSTGDVKVNVTYNGSDKYINSTAMDDTNPEEVITINVEPVATNVTIVVTPDTQNYGSDVVISGQVIDDLGNVVESGTVYIKVNDADEVPVIFSDSTYSYTHTTDKQGVNTVVVRFEATTDLMGCANDTEFNVDKIPTTTTVDILNATAGNVTIKVTVVGDDGAVIKAGQLNITVNGKTTPYVIEDNIVDDEIIIKLNDITTSGEIPVTVIYNGSTVYLPSTGVDSDGNEFTEITVEKQAATITVVSDKETAIIGETVVITGKLTNATGAAIANAYVDLTIGDDTYTVKTNANGEYTYSYQTATVGKVDVVATFNSQPDKYEEVSSEASFNVNKIPTKTTVEILNNTVGNVTLAITTTNNTNDPVTKGHVVVRDNNGQIIAEGDLVNGGINLTLNVNEVGPIGVNVTYLENDIYQGSNATDSDKIGQPDENVTDIDVVAQTATITIEAEPESVTVGDTVTITGEVRDDTGALVESGTVKINVNGQEVGQAEVTNGIYSYEYKPLTIGDYQANATFVGTETIGQIESENVTFTATKIPTKTTVQILNNTVGNITLNITVTNTTDEAQKVITGSVSILDTNGEVIATKDLSNGEAIITLDDIPAGDLRVIVHYNENEIYLASNATDESAISTPQENITVIDVAKIPTKTTVDILNNTIGNVTIGVKVTNETGSVVTEGIVIVKAENGTPVAVGGLTNGEATIKLPAETLDELRVYVEYQENDIYLASNATNSSAIDTPDENITVIDVAKIPTKTTVEVLNTTLGNVTIGVKVTNETDIVVTKGTVSVKDIDGNELASAQLVNGQANITVPADEATKLMVVVEYQENDIYKASNATNSSAIGTPLENVTVIDVTKMPTITTVEVLNTTLSNVTVGVKVTNETGDAVTEGEVYIKDAATNEIIASATLTDGLANITIPVSKAGEFKVIVEYPENDHYLASKAANSSAIGTPDENITVIDVTKIPTKTTVDILNNTIGNITLKVDVTNQTGIPVTKGTVIVKDLTGNVLNETTLTEGTATLNVPIEEVGNAILIVEYQENDIYQASNATNSSAIDTPTENITIINVIKQDVDLTVDVTQPVKAFEDVTISGTLIDDMGKPIPNAEVEVSVDGEVIGTVTTDKDGKYTIDTTVNAGVHTVDVSYPGSEVYNPASKSDEFTVDKLDVEVEPEVIESNPVNTTIKVDVVDEDGNPVDDVPVVIKDENGTVIGEGTIVDGTVDITVPLGPGDHELTVETLETDDYEPNTATLPVSVPKFETELTVDSVEGAILGEDTTISGNLTDEYGNPIANAPVVVNVNGKDYPTTTDEDGNYEVTVPVEKVGENDVTVSYPGDDEHEATSIDTTFDAGKIPTKTTVEVLNTTVGNVTVNVKVTNKTGEEVPNGTVVIKDIDGNIVATGEVTDGVVNITIPVEEPGKLLVQVEYLENDIYLGGNATNESAIGRPTENLTVIDVDSHDSDLTVDVTQPVKAFEDITISGELTDEEGRPIANADVEVSVDGEVIGTVTTDKDGKYTIDTTANAGEHEVVVNYPGNDTYKPASESKDFTVDKLDVEVEPEVIESNPVNTTIKVDVTDEDGNPVDDVPVVIKDENGTVIGEGTIVDGTVDITVPLGPGDHELTVETLETDDYEPNTATLPVSVPKFETELTVDPVEGATLGEDTTIAGNLTDEYGNAIPNADIIVNVNGKDYPTTTDEDGNYEVTVPVEKVGENDVTVSYLGDDEHEATSIDTTFDAGKIPTKTTVEVLNTTVGNVTVNVKVTNKTGEEVPNGTVVIKDIDGNIVATGEVTDGVVNITIPVEEPGKLLVQVEYQENDIYLGGNATNESAIGRPTENLTVIDVGSHDSDLTVDVTQPVKAFEDITISGELTDEEGRPIPNAEVEVSVDGEVIGTVTTDKDGKYSIDTTANAGEHEVVVNYPGNDTYKPTSESKDFTVDKLDVEVEPEVIESNPVNTTIKVDVTDEDGNPVDNVPVVIKDENGTVIGEGTIVDGTVDITVPLGPGDHELTVETLETDDYEPNTATLPVSVPKFETELTVDPVEGAILGEDTTISGNLTDEYGNAIPNADIIVNVNGKDYPTTTDEDGNYEVTVPVDKVGENDVTVSYPGDEEHEATSVDTTFDAGKIPTKSTVEVLNNTVGNVTIAVNVTNMTDEAVVKGTVVVKDMDGNELARGSVVDGVANVTIPVDETGKLMVQVEYLENDIYAANNATNESAIGKPTENITQIDVTKHDSDLTVDVTEPVKAFEDITISGELTDEEGRPIPNADVEVSVDGEVIGTVTTDKDGKYSIDTTANAGEHEVVVNYPGNDTYNPSSESKDFAVDKLDVEIDANATDSNPINTTVQVNVTDEDGNPVDNVPVVIKDENGTVIGNGTITNGTVNITVPLGPGDHNITIETNGTDDYEPSSETIPVSVPKFETELTVDPIDEVPVGENTTVEGTLTDEYGNLIPNAHVVVTVNGKDYPTTTDEDGNYEVTVPAEILGENTVTVSYPGDDEHEPTSIDTTFNAGKIPTKTIVDVLNNTIGNVTISVNVTNTTGVPVTKGTVIVKDIDGNSVAVKDLTDGVANITIPVSEVGNAIFVVEYQENDLYLASNATNESALGKPTENITVINVVKHDSDLTVDVTQPVKAFEDITISGELTDEEGRPIPNADVEVSVDGEVIGTVTTDKDGKYSIDTTANAGEHEVVVSYPGNDTYKPTSESTEFTVDKLDVEIDANVTDSNPINTTVQVNVTDEDGNPVDDVPVVIKDENGTVIGNGTITNGTVNITVPLGPGDHNITIETNGTDDYEPSSETIPVSVPKFETELTVDPVEGATLGENTTITGNLTDEYGNPIPNADIIVNVNGKEYPTTTDEDGNYEVTVPVDKVGENDVVVSYPGDDEHEPTNIDTTFIAGKIPTKSTVEVLNNTVGNVTISVNVTNMTDEAVVNGTVVVKDMDGNELARGSVVDGVANVTIPVDETGKLLVQVEYLENDIYAPNNATNESAIGKPTENLTVIDVDSHDSDLTVDVTQPVKAFEDITISGELTDEEGRPIPNADVEVSVDGEVIGTVTTDKDGKYSIDTTANAGEHEVVVSYPGNDTYKPTNKSTEFTVDKLDVEVDANATNITPENTTIEVNVTDEDGNPVDNVPVVIKDENGTVIGNGTITNGTVNITVPLEPGDHNITIETNGTDDYEPTNTTIPVSVPKHDTNLTVDPIDEVTIGEEAEITGTLTDETGAPIPNANITVTVNGEDIPTTTDKDGKYNLSYPVEVAGQNNVTVTYPGDDKHNPTSENTTFTVDKIPVTVDANATNVTPENTTIEVNVTDEDGNPVDNVPVVIKDENGTVIGNGTITNGTVNITVPLGPGDHNITIETNGTDDYEPTNTTIPVSVPKHDTNLTVDPIENVTYGDNITISGKLTDEEGNPIPNANITVTVNGEEIPVTTDKDGKYNITYPADTVGENNITVKYDGDKYNEPTQVDSTFNTTKAGVNIVVNPIKTYVEENITLQANVTDINGKKLNEGNVIFKINGVTIREGGKLKDANVLKVPVVNGVAKYTFTATRELISAKNIQAVYVENEHYTENRTDATTTANVSLRTAQVIASTQPAIGKQRQNITLVADIYDITHNLRDVRPINDNGSYVIFKVNGLTVKDTDGKVLKVPVVNGVAKTNYYLPNGIGGTKGNTGAYKNYTVTAIYHHPDYYDVRNTSNFNIEREDNVSFVVDNVTIANRSVSIDANLVVPDGENLRGTNVVGVKINGITLTDKNGKPVLFNAENGKVDVDFKLPDNVRDVKNITLVTGNREAYGSATTTITDIPKQASVVTVSPVFGIVEENITLSARVTDTYGNPITGGYVIYKLNGQTLRKGGLVEGSNPIVKIGVKNGWANYTFVANNKLVSTTKLDASYSGTTNFNSSKASTPSNVNISLRKAHVLVTTAPIMAQQNKDITFTINVTDVTHGESKIAPINSKTSIATLKINGLTVKDNEGNIVKVPIVNGTGSYKYKIPQGVGGKVLGTDNYKNYTVTAQYTHADYDTGANDQAVYNIEQSTTSINMKLIVFNSNNKTITLSGDIRDYQNNVVVGNTRFNVKVNGITMKDDSGSVIKYFAYDGKIDLNIKSLTSNPTEVTIVTLGREAYLSTRATSTDIIKA